MTIRECTYRDEFELNHTTLNILHEQNLNCVISLLLECYRLIKIQPNQQHLFSVTYYFELETPKD